MGDAEDTRPPIAPGENIDLASKAGPRVIASFHSSETIETGTLLFPWTEKPKLYPFSDNMDYSVELDINVSKDGTETESSVSVMGTQGMRISIKRGFQYGLPTAHFDLGFAQTENHIYYLYIVINLVGTFEKFLYKLDYNIIQRAKA